MPRTGRPSKLTPEVQAKVCAAIRKGVHLETAAAAAGIGRATIYRWIEQGEAEESGPYREFRDSVRKAEADLELATIEAWQDEGAGSWQSRAEFAARRFRERWGKQDAVKVDATVKVEDVRGGLLEKLARMAGSPSPEGEA
jgi:transposase